MRRRVGAWLGARNEWFWAPALYVFVVLVLYRGVWLGTDGKLRWFGWDCIEYYWSDLAFLAGSLRQAEWPLWNPYDQGGYAFFSDPHPGLYYPVSWVYAGVAAVFGSTPAWVVQAKALLHHAIAGLATHAYLRARRLHPAAAALGGVAWIVSVPMVVHKASALLWPMAWGPLMLLAIDRAISGARGQHAWRHGAFLAAAIAMAGVAGNPPGFFYVLVLAFAYGVMRLLQRFMSTERSQLRAEVVAQARVLAIAAAVTFALLAIVVFPAAEALGASARAARSPGYPFSMALPAAQAIRGMIAPPAGSVDAYCGVVLLGLAIAAVILKPRADRFAPVFFLFAGMFSMALAFGRGTPLLAFFVDHVPGFGLFREPNRYKCLAAMVFAIAGAHGLHQMITSERRRRALIIVLGVMSALFAATVVMKLTVTPHPGFLLRVPAGYTMIFVPLGIGALLLTGIVLLPSRFRPALAAAVVGLTYMDVATFGSWYAKVTEAPVDDQEDRQYLIGLDGVEDRWRVYDEFVMEQRPGSRLRVRDFRGYPSGSPLGDRRYRAVVRQLGRTPQLLEAFNVRWVLHGPHHRSGHRSSHIKRPPSILAPAHFRQLDHFRFEALHPAPLIAWYGAVELANTEPAALSALARVEDAHGQRDRAIVERADLPKSLAGKISALTRPRASVAGELLSYGTDRIVTRIDVPSEGIVVLNEKMFPGWQAEVDGQPHEVFRANYLLRAVHVGRGQHEIVWTFRPARYHWFVVLFVAGLAFVAVAALFSLRAKKKKQTTDSQRQHRRRHSQREPRPGL